MSTPQGRQRLVDGPDQDQLTEDEVAKYLRMDAKTLRRLIKRGRFPRPVQISPGVSLWHWLDVVVYLRWRELQTRMVADDEPDGQTGTIRDKRGQSGTTAKRPHPDA